MSAKLQRLKLNLQDFWRYRYLVYNLINRDFKLKYRRSVLGVLWSVLNPLLMSLVLYVVFSSTFMNVRSEGIDNFAVFILIGQLLFNMFRACARNLDDAFCMRTRIFPFPAQTICSMRRHSQFYRPFISAIKS